MRLSVMLMDRTVPLRKHQGSPRHKAAVMLMVTAGEALGRCEGRGAVATVNAMPSEIMTFFCIPAVRK